MAGSRRRTDITLTLLALLIFLLPQAYNIFGSNLPQYLPREIQVNALQYFLGVFAVMLLLAGALAFLRRTLNEGGIQAYSKRLRRFDVVLTISLGVLGAALGVLGNLVIPAVPSLTQAERAYGQWFSVGLPLCLLLLLILLPLSFGWIQSRATLERKDRQSFLRQLARRYDSYLDDPLQRTVRAAIGIEGAPWALWRPAVAITNKSFAQANDLYLLVPDMGLRSSYEAAEEHLLILGAPGAGKSTQLYELGRELVKEAQSNQQKPMPVVLDLSTWAADKDALDRWLVDALVRVYSIDRGVASRWVASEQIALLLDALDVMGEHDRPLCVEALNTYRLAHPTQPIVVCSRLDEYTHLATKLQMNDAITLQPLTDAAIDEALASGGPRQAALRSAVAVDPELRDALRTPLIFSLVILTYSDLRSNEIPRVGDLQAWRRELFSRYVQRMLGDDHYGGHQPGEAAARMRYSEDDTQRTLAWLGHELLIHNANTLYLERLDQSWLSGKKAPRHYFWLRLLLRFSVGEVLTLIYIVGVLLAEWRLGLLTQQQWGGPAILIPFRVLLGVLLLGVCLSLLIGGEITSASPPVPVARLTWSWRVWFVSLIRFFGFWFLLGVFAWLAGILFGPVNSVLIVGILGAFVGVLYLATRNALQRDAETISIFGREWKVFTYQREPIATLGEQPWTYIFSGLVLGLMAGVVFGAIAGLLAGFAYGIKQGVIFGGGIALTTILATGLVAALGVRIGWLARRGINIASGAEASSVSYLWSWNGVGAGISQAATTTLPSGVFLAWFVNSQGLLLWMVIGAVLFLFIGGAASLSSQQVDESDFQRANEGMWRSNQSALVSGILSAVLTGVVALVLGSLIGVGLLGAQATHLVQGAYGGFIVGLVCALVLAPIVGIEFAVQRGAGVVLKNYALIRTLQWSGVIPAHLIHFLDQASSVVLLRRVGGGYQFVHQLLRDYFAEQYSQSDQE